MVESESVVSAMSTRESMLQSGTVAQTRKRKDKQMAEEQETDAQFRAWNARESKSIGDNQMPQMEQMTDKSWTRGVKSTETHQ